MSKTIHKDPNARCSYKNGKRYIRKPKHTKDT